MLSTVSQRPTPYRGRFAPSPSGLLHFGSLIAALASYLDAKAHQGQWLLRIEDIDPPREMEGAADQIQRTLEAYGLYWDESPLYQSQQSSYYKELLAELHARRLTYHCNCTRAQIKADGGIYQGRCKNKEDVSAPYAIRLNNQQAIYQFNDLIQGKVVCDKALAAEDFILFRKDGLFAYNLAAVADDAYQNISHVIRGCDLLEPTARQLSLFHTLNLQAPTYGHFPLATTDQGYKLSKQNKAPAIDCNNPTPTLIAALNFLGLTTPKELSEGTHTEILGWAISHWQRQLVPQTTTIEIS
ncbi:tRNA glutamyl-Q(34) synthetase GluQRS [Thalassotalea agarivorans]|uniref:Glutamyl-Q tRNA(Asp) synthetase n=1 Tax=Thalassotalea agarivorans TaxID=349064 RepID=A0A1I0GP83_THASX|nr:tRNA glutamyl-Q(34) synthetase GluQRS [Thalassotalea agarivorans]SET72200.1 glutamyl-Q tRNA(Asp) synthetase [Thalassotalea agarivorans]